MQALQFEIVAAIVGLCSLLFFYLSVKMLLSTSWFWGWLKGNLAIFILLSAVVLLLALIDLRTYRPMFNEQAIATISVNTLAPGKHQIRLVDNEGIESVYAITGDSYRLHFNQFRLIPQYENMGLGHGYRLQMIITESVNDGINFGDADSQKYDLTEFKVSQEYPVYTNVWQVFNRYLPSDWIVSAHSIETSSQIAVDNAMYELMANVYDIDIKPLNQVAITAKSNKDINRKYSTTQVTDQTGNDADSVSHADSIILPIDDNLEDESKVKGKIQSKNKSNQAEEPIAVIEEIPPVVLPSASSNNNFGQIVRKPAGSHIKATPAEVITSPSSAE